MVAPRRSHRGSEKQPLRCTHHGGELQGPHEARANSLDRRRARSFASACACDPMKLCELDAAALQVSAMARASRRLFFASAMRPSWCRVQSSQRHPGVSPAYATDEQSLVRYWYELTDGSWGQFTRTQIPHQYAKDLLPQNFQHLVCMQKVTGAME